MWQHFTEGARHAIVRAQRAAHDRSENMVKPEHLLIGLLAETHTEAYRLLQEAGVVVGDLIRHLEGILTPGPGRDGTDLRLDPSARKAIDLAWGEARRQQRSYIGTEHLILGILAADTGATGITFRHFSLDLEKGRYLADTAEQFYPDAPPLAVGSGLAGAIRQHEAESESPGRGETDDAARLRSGLLPVMLLGAAFAVLVMMLRGCG
jgi:ATP-dependent Clp protease ATP-binding subunit ClpA